MKLKALLLSLILAAPTAYAGTVTGNLVGPSGLPVKNGTLTFRLKQAGLGIGVGNVAALTSSCYTSSDGTVVGLPNPLTLPATSINYGTGTMAPGIYFVTYTFLDGSGNRTLPSPELQVQLTGTGTLIVQPPTSFPPNAVGITVYVGPVSGQETAQGNTVGSTASWIQNETPVTTSNLLPTVNNTVCSVTFNDTIIPYTGYDVSLLSSTGAAYPGWPQAWQLNGGANGTVNVSAGAPLWNGVTVYPQPLVAQPLNHGPQSISGPLNMSGYDLVNVGALGIGTSLPAYALDVEGGYINTSLGYLVDGGAGATGQCLVSNGTFFGPGPCGSLPSVYYQFVASNGAALPQRQTLDFQPRFTVADNGGANWSYVDLASTAVTPGSYTNASITVDNYGRVTGAASGPPLPVQQSVVISSGFCTTAATAFASCSISVSWPNTTLFTSGSYALTCNIIGVPPVGVITGLFPSNKTAAGFQLTLQNGTGSGAVASTVSEVDCHGST